jgi:PAS domain S-box-containing protein
VRRLRHRLVGWQESSLQIVAGISIVVALCTVIGALSLLGARIMADTNDRIISRQLALGQFAAHHTDEELAEVERYMDELATAGLSRTLDVLGDANLPRNSMIELLAILGPDGKPVFRGVTDAATQHMDWPTPPDLVLGGADDGVHWSGVFAGPRGRPLVAATLPLRGPDSQQRWLMAAINTSNADFEGLVLAFTRLGETEHAVLVDQSLRVISSSEPEQVLHMADDAQLHHHAQLEHVQSTVRTQQADDPTTEPVARLMTFVPLSRAPWSLALGGSERELLAPVEAWRNAVAALGAFFLVVGLAAGWAITRTLTGPLHLLTSVAERLGEGNLACQIPVVGLGETRTLARSFDAMCGRLRQACDNLQRANAELAVEKSLYETVFRSMGTAVMTVDQQQRVTSMNAAAEVLLGRPTADIIGATCPTLLSTAAGELPAICRQCPVAGPHKPAQCGPSQEALVTPGGRPVLVLTTCSRIASTNGGPAGGVRVMRDISSDEIAALRDAFLANVSHDLRSPLGHIKANATLLLRRDAVWSPRTTRQSLKVINTACDTLERMLENTLNLSQLNGGGLELNRAPVNVRTLVTQAIRRIRPLAHGHRFVTEVAKDLPTIDGDAGWLGHVLSNLLDNAVKYSPPGTTVRVSAALESGVVRVSVADEGPGVAPSERRAIFLRFRRGQNVAAQPVPGSGLGLAICQSVVEAHGGRVWVEDRPDGGSAFSFTCSAWPSEAVS